jgi:hypothetical protein
MPSNAAALPAGAEDNGAAGLRPNYHPHYYAAFAIDADGFDAMAVCIAGLAACICSH